MVVAGGVGAANKPYQPSAPSLCTGKDPGGHWGDAQADCVFACARGDKIRVHAESEDNDVYVYGDASCRNEMTGQEVNAANCGAMQTCHDQGDAPHSGRGKCWGHATEYWASKFTITCESMPAPGEQEKNFNTRYQNGWMQDYCEYYNCGQAQLADPTTTLISGVVQSTSLVTIVVDHGLATGVACGGDGCHPVTPTCGRDETGYYCEL